MHRDKSRYGQDPQVIKRTGDATFYAALKWDDPRRIFTCSWSDFFIKEADEWRVDAWEVIRNTPHHKWQILTKRPERILECLPHDWDDGWDNVWLGVSVENEDYMSRAEKLAQIPAKIRFISIEPLLERIDLSSKIGLLKQFHWVIIGGESGNDKGSWLYRECNIEWIQKLIHDLNEAGLAVFVKQLGTHLSKAFGYKDRHGGDWDEWPRDIKIREFPDA